jgi:hypothetical protein
MSTPSTDGLRMRWYPLLPDPGRSPLRWSAILALEGALADHGPVTVHVEGEGARILHRESTMVALPVGGRATFFIVAEQEGDASHPHLVASLPGRDVAPISTGLPLGIDLCEVTWERWHQGDHVSLAEIAAPPPTDAGPWQSTPMPATWREGGVTWLRARFVIPQPWRSESLRLTMRSVSRADATFLNGVEVGRTAERGVPRCYHLPPEAVRWGQQNELCIAVDLPLAPTTVPQFRGVGGVRGTPVQIVAGELPSSCALQAGYVPQVETKRSPQRPSADPHPLRALVVRDGVLCYADEDLDDFVASGIEAIRIHVFDTEISDRRGNLIHNEHLDVLDYIAAGCTRRGIYLWLTPLAWWGSPQSRPDALSRHTNKQAMSMWPEAWAAEAEYLGQFLAHVNPYTGRLLVDEPCLALFEVMNEPWYWSYPEVMGLAEPAPGELGIADEDTRVCLAGVRRAWQSFVPSPAWDRPQAFIYWRYDTLRRYIDAMVGAIRSTGAAQPIAYSAFHSGYPRSDIEQALADSRCDALTTWAYPGGLEIEPTNDRMNILPGAANTSLDVRLAHKARLVYEFDAAGLATSCYMYPALARCWRNIGVQVACQFQYDCTSLAPLNWAWETHYLNLRHTPEKWVSFMIAGEVFRRLPRGATFATPDDDQVFGPAAVSFRRNTALLCAGDCYMQARPTDWRPLPLPAAPRRIVAVGPCPYYDWEGTGIVMLQVEGDVATLRIYPDVQRLQHKLRGTLEQPLTRLVEAEHPFRLHLPGWLDARVERLDDGQWQSVPGTADEFIAHAGDYRLSR